MSTDLIARLIEAGTPAALVAEVAMALGRAAGDQEALAERRERDAARQRAKRGREAASRDVTGDHVTSCDTADVPPLPAPALPPDPQPTPTHTPVIKSRASAKGRRLPENWTPKQLPQNVAGLVAQWPPGRLDRELDGFRDFWTSLSGADALKLDWDKTWHNRIRDRHDRIMKENRNGQSGHHRGYSAAGDHPGGRTGAALDRVFTGMG